MKTIKAIILTAATVAAPALLTTDARAHCDSMDGPVIQEALHAFEKGDVSPLLKWVAPEHETEIISAFEKVTALSKSAPEASEMARLWFLETLVRIHREGEGAPYTGIKPAGEIAPWIRRADLTLENDSLDGFANEIANSIAAEIRTRFSRAAELRKSAAESPGVGREFVEAYVQYVHFIEEIEHLLHHAESHH